MNPAPRLPLATGSEFAQTRAHPFDHPCMYSYYSDGDAAVTAHPGVAPIPSGEEVTHHKYYQWVVFTLFFQGIKLILGLFYLFSFD